METASRQATVRTRNWVMAQAKAHGRWPGGRLTYGRARPRKVVSAGSTFFASPSALTSLLALGLHSQARQQSVSCER